MSMAVIVRKRLNLHLIKDISPYRLWRRTGTWQACEDGITSTETCIELGGGGRTGTPDKI